MLPENLRERAVAAAVADFDSDAVVAGQYNWNELMLEIGPPKIVSVCGFLKYDQKFVRLSSVTAVDRYPAEPRFEAVYHLYSVERNEWLRLKCRIPGTDLRTLFPGGPETEPDHAAVVDALVAKVKLLAGTPYPVRFVAQSGDATWRGADGERWEQFTPIAERITLGANLPFLFVPGNHDEALRPYTGGLEKLTASR